MPIVHLMMISYMWNTLCSLLQEPAMSHSW